MILSFFSFTFRLCWYDTKRIADISCSEIEMGPDKEFHLLVDLFCTQRTQCFILPTYGPPPQTLMLGL